MMKMILHFTRDELVLDVRFRATQIIPKGLINLSRSDEQYLLSVSDVYDLEADSNDDGVIDEMIRNNIVLCPIQRQVLQR